MNILEAIEQSIQGAGVSVNTQKAYRSACTLYLLPFLNEHGISGHDSVSKLTPTMFIRFPGWMNSKELSKASKQLYTSGVTSLYNWLVENELVEPTPAQMLKYARARKNVSRLHESQSPVIPSDAEFDLFVRTAQQMNWPELHKRRNVAMILFMRYSGVRVSELRDLLVKDIDPINLSVIVRMGKGRKTRKVFITQEVMDAVQSYWQLRGHAEQDEAVFQRHDFSATQNDNLSDIGIRWVVTEIRKACDLPHFHPHTFRHLFITDVVRKSGDITVAQTLAGHTQIATTQKYTHLNDMEVEEQYKRIFQ